MYIAANVTVAANPPLSFTEEELKTINEKFVAIADVRIAAQQKWLTGQEKVEAGWDKYINDLKENGLEEMIAAYQSAYTRYLAIAR